MNFNLSKKGHVFFISSWNSNIHSNGNMITNLSWLHITVGPVTLRFNKLLQTSLRIEPPFKIISMGVGWGTFFKFQISYTILLNQRSFTSWECHSVMFPMKNLHNALYLHPGSHHVYPTTESRSEYGVVTTSMLQCHPRYPFLESGHYNAYRRCLEEGNRGTIQWLEKHSRD